MNTPTDKEVRDWYMGYGVDGRAELAGVEGEAFDRYLAERDARVAKATEERIIELIEDIPTKGIRTEDGREILSIELKDIIKLIKEVIK